MGAEIGRRIAGMLEKRNMTQRELATRVCVQEAQLSRYVNGSSVPRPETLANIATALGTTSDYLLGLTDGEFEFGRVRRLIARNSRSMTEEQKKAIINALYGEE